MVVTGAELQFILSHTSLSCTCSKNHVFGAHRAGLSRKGSFLIQGLAVVLLGHMMGWWNMCWEKSFHYIFHSSFLMLTPHSSKSPNTIDFFIIYPWTCSASGRPEYEGHKFLQLFCLFAAFLSLCGACPLVQRLLLLLFYGPGLPHFSSHI